MKQVQICVKQGYNTTRYFDVVIDNKQGVKDAISIIKNNCYKFGFTPLAYIGLGLNGVRQLDQFNKYKAGTVIDGDFNSYYFGTVLIKGGDK